VVMQEILTYHLHGIASEKGISVYNDLIKQKSI